MDLGQSTEYWKVTEKFIDFLINSSINNNSFLNHSRTNKDGKLANQIHIPNTVDISSLKISVKDKKNPGGNKYIVL